MMVTEGWTLEYSYSYSIFVAEEPEYAYDGQRGSYGDGYRKNLRPSYVPTYVWEVEYQGKTVVGDAPTHDVAIEHVYMTLKTLRAISEAMSVSEFRSRWGYR